jgi:hypothetical protein
VGGWHGSHPALRALIPAEHPARFRVNGLGVVQSSAGDVRQARFDGVDERPRSRLVGRIVHRARSAWRIM